MKTDAPVSRKPLPDTDGTELAASGLEDLRVIVPPGAIRRPKQTRAAWLKHVRRIERCRTGPPYCFRTDTGHLVLSAHPCGSRWCPPCARVRGMELVSRGTLIGRPSLVTLTARPSQHVVDAWATAWERWRQFYLRMRRRGYRGTYIAALEAHPGGGEADGHPHLHVCWGGGWLPLEKLREWSDATGWGPQPDIKGWDTKYGEAQAGLYLSKYISKPGKCPPWLPQVLYRYRIRSYNGSWGLEPPRQPKWQRVGMWDSPETEEASRGEAIYSGSIEVGRGVDSWYSTRETTARHVRPRLVQGWPEESP